MAPHDAPTTSAADEADLVVDGSCPECGAPFSAGIWDHTVRCTYCGSTLVSAGDVEHEVFVLADARADADIVAISLARDIDAYRARLSAPYRGEGGLRLEIPAILEARVERYAARLRAEVEVRESVDFLVPYEVHEQLALQAILGRRRAAKESYVQAFQTEGLRRLYDPAVFNLRDRGLKIGGAHLLRLADASTEMGLSEEAVGTRRLSDENTAMFGGRFLEVVELSDEAAGAWRFDRAGVRVRPDTQIIARFHTSALDRRIRVYKHMTYVCLQHGSKTLHYLLDRQFGTIAGTLGGDEVEKYRSLPTRSISDLVGQREVRRISSDCPNCGWELDLPRHERISFCPTCYTAVAVAAKGLEPLRYEITPLPGDCESAVYFPFWSFPFTIRANGETYSRIWDWLEAVAPQTWSREYVQTEPGASRLFLPARAVFGTETLDDVFCQITGYVNWAQPRLVGDRQNPDPRIALLGAELSADDARRLAPIALVSLHDNASTRRLNARNFKALIEDAEIPLEGPTLCCLPFRFDGEHWKDAITRPGATLRGFSRTQLLAGWDTRRLTKRFALV